MASDIHRKRTGKSFKISEEIVTKEEMYEEEDDDLPRSLRVLTSHLKTGSPDFDFKLQSFVANRVVMASMVAGISHEEWLKNDPINKMFAQQFSGASTATMPNQMYRNQPHQQPHAQTPSNQSPISPGYSNVSPVAYQSPSNQYPRDPSDSAGHPRRNDDSLSPPALTPRSASQTPQSRATPVHSSASVVTPMTEYPQHSGPNSSFTSAISNDVKMMMPGFDMGFNNFMDDSQMYTDMTGNTSSGFYPNFTNDDLMKQPADGMMAASQPSYYASPNSELATFQFHSTPDTATDGPGGNGMGDVNWDSWINDPDSMMADGNATK